MSATAEAQFEKIAQDAIEAAEAIACLFADFVDGLKAMAVQLRHRAEDAAAEQLERTR